MICNFGDVVVVPFPFVDNAKVKPRPAAIMSSQNFNASHDHTIMAMITTATIKWRTDIEIENIKLAGLPVKSFIRLKLFTLDNRLIKKNIGSLEETTIQQIKKVMSKCLFV